jgi:hypothetical protein
MPPREDTDLCAFCKRGRLVQRNRELAFHQATDKGEVFCRVTIPVTVCEQCRSMTWGANAEADIEQAVRREYDKLP